MWDVEVDVDVRVPVPPVRPTHPKEQGANRHQGSRIKSRIPSLNQTLFSFPSLLQSNTRPRLSLPLHRFSCSAHLSYISNHALQQLASHNSPLLNTPYTQQDNSNNSNKMSGLPPQKFLELTAAPKSSFLSLAPATSASYPKKQAVRSHTRAQNIPAGVEQIDAMPRRSSSASTSSANSYRVLKLGPVHWGEHPDEHKEDFHDVILS